jgi:hypothetical protein
MGRYVSGATDSRSSVVAKAFHSRRRISAAVVALVAFSLIVALLPAQSAHADAGTCQVSGSNYHDGVNQAPSDNHDFFRGAVALLNVVSPNLCLINGTPSGFSLSTVMLSDHYGGEWAQSGFIRCAPPCSQLYHFSQWYHAGVPHTVFLPTPAYVNQSYWYVEFWTATCVFQTAHPCVQMRVGGTIMDETNFDPFGNWVEPFLPQWFGETYYREDDVPGVPPTHSTFTQMQVENWDTTILPQVPPLAQHQDNNFYDSDDHYYCQIPVVSQIQANRYMHIWSGSHTSC